MGYLDEIPVCVGYEIDGKVTRSFPTAPLLDRAKQGAEYLLRGFLLVDLRGDFVDIVPLQQFQSFFFTPA